MEHEAEDVLPRYDAYFLSVGSRVHSTLSVSVGVCSVPITCRQRRDSAIRS
jgi:hypothetical protein